MENESLGKVFSRVLISPPTWESSRLFGIIRSRGNVGNAEASNYDWVFSGTFKNRFQENRMRNEGHKKPKKWSGKGRTHSSTKCFSRSKHRIRSKQCARRENFRWKSRAELASCLVGTMWALWWRAGRKEVRKVWQNGEEGMESGNLRDTRRRCWRDAMK